MARMNTTRRHTGNSDVGGKKCEQAQKGKISLSLILILSVAEYKATYVMIPNLQQCPDLQVHMPAEDV